MRYSSYIFLAVLSAGILTGQTGTSSIRGTVYDPKEAVVAGVTVTLTNIATSESRTTTTTELGLYSFMLLPPATYRLEAQARGFKRFAQESIQLDVGLAAAIPIRLELGAASETVTVTAEAPLLESVEATLGHQVSNATVINLPTNGRNAYGFAALVPGVRAPVGFTQVSVGLYNEQFVSINGSRMYNSTFLMDGGTNANPAFNGATLYPSVDSVQEYRVQTNNFSAEFSNSAGGIINLVTKSGNNTYHGSAFEFLRNDKLGANNFFSNKAGLPRGVFRYNQFGGTLGGPFTIPRLYNAKNRTFFFFSYEGLRWIRTITTTGSVPTVPQLNGDFSSTRNATGQIITIYDPFATTPNPSSPGAVIRTPFAGNVIPLSRIDPVVRNLLPYIPRPNAAGNPFTNVNNFVNNSSAPTDKNTFSGRLDETITSNQRIFGRYSHNYTFNGRPYIFSQSYTPAAIIMGNEGDPSLQAVIDYTNVLTPTLVLELNSSFVEYQLHREGASFGFDPVQLGFSPVLHQDPLHPCFPVITATGLGFSASVSQILSTTANDLIGACSYLSDVYNTFGNSANVSKNSGHHTLKFGGNFATSNLNTLRNLVGASQYDFTSAFTQGPNPLVSSSTAGLSFASFLLGTGADGNVRSSGPGVSINFKTFGAYFQDDWKISGRLTLDLGLRYDYYTPFTERYNQISDLDFTSPSPIKVPGLNLRGGLMFPGVGGLPRGGFDPDRDNVAPRFGFAYMLNQNTVLRGGYGIFRAPSTGDGFNSNAIPSSGFVANSNWVPTTDGVTPVETLANAYSGGLTFAPGSKQGLATFLGQDLLGFDRSKRNAYAQQWNFDIQRSLPGNFVADVAYAGSRGLRLYANVSDDQLPDQYLALGNALQQTVPNPFYGIITTGSLSTPTVPYRQLLRPYPQFSSVTAVSSSYGSSTYHSLQVKVERRFQHGFGILGAYTFSKLLDDVTMITPYPGTGDTATPNAQDFDNNRNERAVAVFDAPHNVAISGIWELPFGAHKRYLNGSRAARVLAGGWQINSIATFRSGAPLTFPTASNNLFNFGGTQRASWTGVSPYEPGSVQQKLTDYFNPAAFTQPAPFTYGNTPRLTANLRGPGVNNFDLSLFRNIPITEKANLQFRAEAFNIFNRVQFGLPATTIGTSSAGAITSQVNAPRDIQFALKLLF
jgi:outer membrane receptor protein involved in Fe transport